MALLTITNLTNEPILLQELYTTVQPGKSVVTDRYHDDLHQVPRIQKLWLDGDISVTITTPTEESDFIEQKIKHDGAGSGASATATRLTHNSIITPATINPNIIDSPAMVTYGPLAVATFAVDLEIAYANFKIPTSFVDTPTFHIHWTKSGNADESGGAVWWEIEYIVFDGATEDGNNAGAITNIVLFDQYADSGTTTRIVHRTGDGAATGFVAGSYVGLSVKAVTGEGGLMTSEPALVSLDLTFNEYINQ